MARAAWRFSFTYEDVAAAAGCAPSTVRKSWCERWPGPRRSKPLPPTLLDVVDWINEMRARQPWTPR